MVDGHKASHRDLANGTWRVNSQVHVQVYLIPKLESQHAQNKKTEVAHCSIIYSSIKQGQNQSVYQEGSRHVNWLTHARSRPSKTE